MSSTTPFPNLKTSNLIDLSYALESVRFYKAAVPIGREDDATYAFKIAHQDVLTALGIKLPAEATGTGMFRVYLGLTTEDPDSRMRMFLVPMNDVEEDVFPEGADGQLKVYDFNAPCPTTCDKSSPLYYKNV